jgi:hypothetical protein
MKTGSIKINIEEGKTPSVETHLVGGNLWLTKNELARFFGVFVQKIDAELRNIFKDGLLFEADCTYCNRYTDTGIEKQTMYYNLEVLIFLSYRINSFEAKIFRQFVNSALREHLRNNPLPEINLFWAFPTMLNKFCLN